MLCEKNAMILDKLCGLYFRAHSSQLSLFEQDTHDILVAFPGHDSVPLDGVSKSIVV